MILIETKTHSLAENNGRYRLARKGGATVELTEVEAAELQATRHGSGDFDAMAAELTELGNVYRRMAAAAMAAGVEAADESPIGALAKWVADNAIIQSGAEFYVVFGVACAMADIRAEREGFKSAADKAAANVFEGKQ